MVRGCVWIRISDPRSQESWCIKEAEESLTRVTSSVSLMRRDLSDLDQRNPFRGGPLYNRSSFEDNKKSNIVGNVCMQSRSVLLHCCNTGNTLHDNPK